MFENIMSSYFHCIQGILSSTFPPPPLSSEINIKKHLGLDLFF